MPKTQRDLYRRRLAQAYININWSATYILELYNIFNPVHPELAAYLMNTLEGLEVVTDLLTRFAQESWGHTEINWASWSADGRPTHGIQDKLDESIDPTTDAKDDSPIIEANNDNE